MNKKTETKVRQGDPELTTSKKLDQIKTGAKIKRQTGGTEKKDTIISGKNGSKTVVRETEEKFEETAVLRKKEIMSCMNQNSVQKKTPKLPKSPHPNPHQSPNQNQFANPHPESKKK